MSKYIDIISPWTQQDLVVHAKELNDTLGGAEESLHCRLSALEAVSEQEEYGVERVETEKFSLNRLPQKASAVDIFLPESLSEKGVKILSAKEASEQIPQLYQNFKKQYSEKFQTTLDSFHRAFCSGATFLYIPPKVQCDQAIQIKQLIEGTCIQYLIILVDEQAQIELDNHVSSQGSEEVSAHLNIFLYAAQGSHISYYGLDELDQEVTSFIRRWGLADRDSNIQWTLAALNNGHVIEDIHVDLIGEGAESDLRVSGISSGDQIQVVNSLVTNRHNQTRGYISQRGVIFDQSTLTFNGIGRIIKGAKGADNDQESRVLMLSDDARGDTNPILLIDEFEVVAGHAASIGRIDEEDLFYLMSRGISRQVAETLFIRGFLLDQISEALGQERTNEWLNEFLRKL